MAVMLCDDITNLYHHGMTSMTTVFEGTLFADYHQFYLADTESETDYSGEITDAAMTERIVWKGDVLAVFTARNMEVPVTVELHGADADHVVEAGLRSSGTLVIAGCTDYLPTAARFSVPAGDLRARIVLAGPGTLSEDGRGSGPLRRASVDPLDPNTEFSPRGEKDRPCRDVAMRDRPWLCNAYKGKARFTH